MYDTNDIFIDKGIYKLKQIRDESVFLCEALQGSNIGKLVMFNKGKKGTYNRTSTQYFLNNYIVGDLKELFTCRENYDMVGQLGYNFAISTDKQTLIN